mmetsp:Transcript_52209/g.59661  ORF Transcript_52209/g.59661 Transcript_52209/m.59661 type:complete len:83 (-) Transcript_52209:960-1208(-)
MLQTSETGGMQKRWERRKSKKTKRKKSQVSIMKRAERSDEFLCQRVIRFASVFSFHLNFSLSPTTFLLLSQRAPSEIFDNNE